MLETALLWRAQLEVLPSVSCCLEFCGKSADSLFGTLFDWSENNLVANELGFGLLHTRSWFARPVEDRRLVHRMHKDCPCCLPETGC